MRTLRWIRPVVLLLVLQVAFSSLAGAEDGDASTAESIAKEVLALPPKPEDVTEDANARILSAQKVLSLCYSMEASKFGRQTCASVDDIALAAFDGCRKFEAELFQAYETRYSSADTALYGIEHFRASEKTTVAGAALKARIGARLKCEAGSGPAN